MYRDISEDKIRFAAKHCMYTSQECRQQLFVSECCFATFEDVCECLSQVNKNIHVKTLELQRGRQFSGCCNFLEMLYSPVLLKDMGLRRRWVIVLNMRYQQCSSYSPLRSWCSNKNKKIVQAPEEVLFGNCCYQLKSKSKYVDYQLELVLFLIIYSQTKGNQQMHPSETVESRGLVEIVYSTTSGTSKLAADRLQEILQDNKYLAPVINIGDYQIEDLLNHTGTIIFLLSTYGDGSSPADGEKFLEWLESLKPGQQFSKLDFAICAFGNSNFEKHCGFGVTVQNTFKDGSGNELIELTKCDASSIDRNVDARFPDFIKKLVETLNAKNPLRQISKSALSTPFQVTCEDRSGFDWQQNASKMHNVGQEFTNYWNMHKCRVIHIKQMRTGGKDSRSTLWVRLEINKNIRLSPACNVQIFPLNSLQNDPQDPKIVVFSEVKGKVPFPPMPYRELRKILDLHQKASNKQIKNALLLATGDHSIVEKYQNMLKEKVQIDVSIQQLTKQLKPKLQFLPFINLNRVRTYTLSSWDQQHRYLDLTLAITPKGLTSTYLQTFPEYVRMRPIDSTFYIPEDRPLVMIANGSGIAPFRSIVEYIVSNKVRLPYIRLYYGIQSEQVDYYYGQEWRQYQKNQVLEVKLAQSRKNPQVKEYVQNVLEKDKNWLQEHIFKNNGVVFICGGGGMCKDVGNVIFNVVAAQTKVPYKAFAQIAQLKNKKTIVEEAFDS